MNERVTDVAQKMTQCSEDGCEMRPKARGLCSLHYSKWSRGTLGKPKREPILGCTVDGCQAKHSARGLCATHYWQAMHGKPATNKPKRTACTVAGCPNRHYCKGLCRPHYDQQRYTTARTADGPRPRPKKKATMPAKPVSKLPAGWDKAKPPKPKNAPKTTNLPEIGIVGPTPQKILDAARRVVLAHGAGDLAEMLGLVA